VFSHLDLLKCLILKSLSVLWLKQTWIYNPLLYFVVLKECAMVEICVRLIETSGIVSASGDATNSLIEYCQQNWGEQFWSLSHSLMHLGRLVRFLKVELLNSRKILSFTLLRLVTNINLYRMIIVKLLLSALRKKILAANGGFILLLC